MARGTAWTRARRREAPWDPEFAERSPLFLPIRDAARRLVACAPRAASSFPTPEEIDAALAPLAGVRFVAARPRPSRGWRAADKPAGEDLYDARIARRGEVPTRPGSWHDLANALVWAAFPKSKRALHARQDRVIAACGGRPAARPRELDALALLDEGGVLALDAGGELLFGHALYEALVLGARPMTGFVVSLGSLDGGASADDALAACLADEARFRDPRDGARARVASGAIAAKTGP